MNRIAWRRLTAAELAVERLRGACDLLRAAGALRAAERVRRALVSAEGAVRHFSRKVPIA